MKGRIRIIATDEAGYGPRLGPLIIAASVWDIHDTGCDGDGPAVDLRSAARRVFGALGKGIALTDGTQLAIQDSKQVFKRNHDQGLAPLERTVAVFMRMTNSDPQAADMPTGPGTLAELIHTLAPSDVCELLRQPWFECLDEPFPACGNIGALAPGASRETRDALCRCGATYLAGAARVVDAAMFNDLCLRMGNKATVLSESTVELVHRCMHAHGSPDRVEVFSDRHGGRMRYAALLQRFFPDSIPRIVYEDPHESRYRLVHRDVDVDWRFSVKGDRFPPVALASMFAKYLRERLMGKVNAFWAHHHGRPLVPTAGYSADATRFCVEIEQTAKRLGIVPDRYIRQR